MICKRCWFVRRFMVKLYRKLKMFDSETKKRILALPSNKPIHYPLGYGDENFKCHFNFATLLIKKKKNRPISKKDKTVSRANA